MSQDCLIAEIADDNIRYIVVKFDENSGHKILSKKILVYQKTSLYIVVLTPTKKLLHQSLKFGAKF